MQQHEPGRGDPIRALDWRHILPFDTAVASDQLGWVGLEAARCRAEPAFELSVPAIAHHRLVLVTRPPEDLDLRYEGVKRHRPTPAGSITLVPAGSPVWARSSGHKDELHIFLEAGVVARVAADTFDLDPVHLMVPPLDGVELPHLRAAMFAVDAELTAGGAGGQLASESLANVLAVQLIRHVLASRRPARGREGTLPRAKLRAVVEYVEEHLDAAPSLDQLAAVARLSAYHFARQFKAATGLPPHQYVIMRRVERAKELLEARAGLPLAEVALRAGFSDQSQFTHHFKRLVGVTPGEFQTPASIAQQAATSPKKPVGDPTTIPQERDVRAVDTRSVQIQPSRSRRDVHDHSRAKFGRDQFDQPCRL
jgi:AraC family transcriptional regulator